MAAGEIVFNDGAAYERYMGVWSRTAGEAFLAWLAPAPGLRWLDVGCGNGAFTEMIMERCAPTSLHGIDPSGPQLEYARARPALRTAQFRKGDAMALPFPDRSFDAAVMPLVIFFVPDPDQGVAEMARVSAPGGLVCAYAWDMPGGGFPYAPLQEEMGSMGFVVPKTPRPDAARLDALQAAWRKAGLENIGTRAFAVQRTFPDFEDYWTTVRGGPSMVPVLASMTAGQIETLRNRMRARLSAPASGPITLGAVCNAVKGNVPGGKA
jgi:ubiquinone/menaquinone biosynthesis C-methylase UbiE